MERDDGRNKASEDKASASDVPPWGLRLENGGPFANLNDVMDPGSDPQWLQMS